MPRILIVEDDKYLNKLLTDRLAIEGFEVHSVLEGESALEILEKSQGTEKAFDLMLSDMLLPKLMGAELFAKIHELNLAGSLRLMAMSGIYKNPTETKEVSTLYGLESYWTKPFDIEELVHAIAGAEVKISKKSNLAAGKLIDRSVERLFVDCYHAGFTGKLTIKRNDAERRIYFSNGFPVSADSTAVSESLGQSLLMMGLIDQEALQQASRRMVEEKSQFGQTLIKMGAITKEQLFQALRKHTYRILVNTIAWRDGDFEFTPLKELPAHILALEFNSILLMMRAHKALYQSSFLKSLYDTKMDSFCLFSERAFQILPLFNLDAGSLHFFQALPGTENLAQILKLIPETNHDMVFRVFYLLEALGLIEWQSAPNRDHFNEVSKADFRSEFDAEKEVSSEAGHALQAEYMDLLNKDYFELLEVTPESSLSDIEESYRATRYRLHPDRFGQKIGGQTKRILDDMLGRIDRAYQTLADPEKKEAYLISTKRLKQDSLADSKKFLEAQDFFREGLQHLKKQDFQQAKISFDQAHQKWDRGIEYRLYSIYCEFKIASQSDQKEASEKILQSLKTIASQHRTIDTGFLLLGHAYQAAGKADLAKEAYQIALQNNDKNDEAAHALARLGNDQFKKMSFSSAVGKSKAGLKKILIAVALIGSVVGIYLQRLTSIHKEDGITALDPKEFDQTIPLLSIRQKVNVAKIVVREKWIGEVPDPVLNSKCVDLLNRLKSRGIMELYFYEDKVGLKAYCVGEKLLRY